MQKKYTKENLSKLVKESYSIAEVCKKLGLKPAGGNYYTIHKYCDLYGIDLSEFVGMGWKNIDVLNNQNKTPLSDIFNNQTNFKSSHLKKRLIEAGIKENICEICKCTNVWQNKPITLQLHHKNGNHFDNSLENLQILCPNCHSQQESHQKPKTTRTDNTKFKKHNDELKRCVCQFCGKEFQADRFDRARKFCSIDCYREYVKKFGSRDIQKFSNYSKWSQEYFLLAMNKAKNITDLARILNSHRCTIREYLHRYNLYDQFIEQCKQKK